MKRYPTRLALVMKEEEEEEEEEEEKDVFTYWKRREAGRKKERL